MSLAELKQQLSEDSNGQNLYAHLVEVLIKLADNPKKAYENFQVWGLGGGRVENFLSLNERRRLD